MKTAEEYIALAEHCRAAKLGTTNATARNQLETFERSYFVLAESTKLLGRSIVLQQALQKRDS